ncbi:MAG: Gfo/Idh/MocA family oxidoreductase [Phycisphaerae bacterium]
MNAEKNPFRKTAITRREFVQTATAAGLMMTVPTWAQESPENAGDLKIAIVGFGSQGYALVTFCLKIPGVRFVAVCDIWPYRQRYASNLLKKYDQPVNVYEDYRAMLDKERELDAVIVATPDWVHAEHTIACLHAGQHVYCEKEMSNTIETARQMVLAARETGKLLQIGHQRRSSPRYWHALKMIEKDKILGRITHTYGQWNRARLLEQGWPKGQEVPAKTLERYGYGSMDEFRNWRWYRKYSGGPISDLGSHQVDIFNWFLKARPKAVLASGGLDYYTEQRGRDWYDNVLAIYEYETAAGPVRGFYEVLNTTSYGGFYEQFMGDEGSLVISDDGKTGYITREVHAKRREWEDEAAKIEKMGREAIELKIGETLTPEGKKDPEGQRLAAESQKDSRLLHLENFFNAVRSQGTLTCPPEVGFETCVSVLRVNEAVEAGRRIKFKPEEFVV